LQRSKAKILPSWGAAGCAPNKIVVERHTVATHNFVAKATHVENLSWRLWESRRKMRIRVAKFSREN
jgi:hypothetical protein